MIYYVDTVTEYCELGVMQEKEVPGLYKLVAGAGAGTAIVLGTILMIVSAKK